MTDTQLKENVAGFSYYYHLLEQSDAYVANALECSTEEIEEIQNSRMGSLVWAYATDFNVSFDEARDAMFSLMYDYDYENN